MRDPREGRQRDWPADVSVVPSFLTNLVPDRRAMEDRTNLGGRYDVQIDWAPETPAPPTGTPPAPSDPNAPSVFTAVREQLGLRLEAARQQADVLIVDHVERPTENCVGSKRDATARVSAGP